jgi:hypothetical protein
VRALNIVANRLLATLPGSILNAIEPHFSTVTLAAGTIVHQPDDEVHHLYFPSDGFVSLQIVAGTGTFIDTALVGRDGALGPMAGIGRYTSKVRCVVRSALAAMKVSGI